jgi:hypothetical protein
MMKRIANSPYLLFPLGAAVVMALLVGWSLLLSDRLAVNNLYAVFLLLLPVLSAVYCFSGQLRASGGRRVVKWVGSTVLSELVSVIVLFAAMALIPVKARAAYNYPHFYPGTYPGAREQIARAGGKAPDETLYTLQGDAVSVAGLWTERPIVIEFGSVT